jgi:transcriptional regulator with GAF, ATPase, and Fis domain
MTTNKDEFFREATLRICGHLEIEQAMASCLNYLKSAMPADRLHMQLFDPGYGAMRTIAHATQDGAQELDLLTPLSEEAQEHIRQAGRMELPDVIVLNDPESAIVGREMLQFHGVKASSLLLMPLMDKERTFGSLVLCAESGEKHTAEHAELFALLKEPFTVAMSNALQHREVVKLKDLLADDNRYLHDELRPLSGDAIVGANFGLKPVMEMVRQVAPTESPVLLLGETGVGKDVIAHAIHQWSDRREGPFITVNCGAIPDTLLDSELFGHEKGAFTGALAQKRGRFERAHKGTIFLDEIGELPLQAQVRLLRVLQDREVERVGGTRPVRVDIRIIAATHRNLEEMIVSKAFREDLWFRLNVFPITIPPLRQRREDIPALVQHFIQAKTRTLRTGTVPSLADGALDVLTAYRWPGNVRELENVVERAMILCKGGPLEFDRVLGPVPAQTAAQGPGSSVPSPPDSTKLDDVVRSHVQSMLALSDGKIHGAGGAAELLGMNPNTLRSRMRKLGIPFAGAGRGAS